MPPLNLALRQHLKPETNVKLTENNILSAVVDKKSEGMKANEFFFSHPKWAKQYFNHENTQETIGDRWMGVTGNWDNKIVVDLGCGPGNLYRAVTGKPKVLIGVDISETALVHARKMGYVPLHADVQNLPLISDSADIVTANATLHHVDDVEKTLTEAARLVKPGGMLITDEDPIAFNVRKTIPGHLFQCVRFIRSFMPSIKLNKNAIPTVKFHSRKMMHYRQKTELHYRFMGDGISKETYYKVLEPLGFTVKLYPHTHRAGKEIFNGDPGKHSIGVQIDQRLNKLDAESFCSVMCVAIKNK